MSGKDIRPPGRRVNQNVIFQLNQDTSRIVCVDEHPVKPWIVTCHDNSLVRLWDYTTNELLQTFSIDESLKRDKARAAGGALVRNAFSFLERGEIYSPVGGSKASTIYSVCFFDRDVQKFKFSATEGLALQENMKLSLESREVYQCNWIVVSTDSRIVFFNYVTQHSKDLKLSELDGKVQNCLVPVGLGPLIAFGGADGVIRVWNMDTWSLSHRLCTQSGHKSIQFLESAIGVRGESILISAGSEGALFWWKDFGDAPTAKKNVGEVLDVSWSPLTGEIITTSNDKSVSWWNILTGDYEGQVKSSNKTVYSKVCRFSHPRFPCFSALVCTANDSKIFLFNKEGTLSELLDVNDAPGKKNRISDIRTHPSRPDLIICSTRTSLVVLSVASICTPSFALLESKERKGGSRRRESKVAYMEGNSKLVVTGLRKKGKTLSQKLATGYVKLSSSNSGRFLGIMWIDDNRYQILDTHNYDKNASTWAVVDEGAAQDLAWFGSKDVDQFCIIGLKTEEKEEKVKKRLIISTTNKKITVEKQIQDIQMRQINENALVNSLQVPTISNCDVVELHGGMILGFHLDSDLNNPLLDIERKNPLSSSSSSTTSDKGSKNSTRKKMGTVSSDSGVDKLSTGTDSEKCMRWILTDDDNTTIDYPNPRWLLWDPLERYCLLVYPDHFTIATLRPKFSTIFHCQKMIISAVWHKNALFYCTDRTIECKFLGTMPITIASSDVQEAFDLMEQFDGESLDQHLLPNGIVSLLTVSDDVLYLLDSVSVIHQIPIKASQLRFYFLAAGKQPKEALQLVDFFPRGQHEALAQFLCAQGHAATAVDISTLGPLTKIKICLKYRLFSRMIEFLPALESRVARSNALKMEVKDIVRESCALIQDPDLVTELLTSALFLGSIVKKDLVLHLAAQNSKKKLRALYDEWVSAKKNELAFFCAQFLDEQLVEEALQHFTPIGDFATLSRNLLSEEERVVLTETLNSTLLQDQRSLIPE